MLYFDTSISMRVCVRYGLFGIYLIRFVQFVGKRNVIMKRAFSVKDGIMM